MIGGDLNDINVDKLSASTGLTALVDFPHEGHFYSRQLPDKQLQLILKVLSL